MPSIKLNLRYDVMKGYYDNKIYYYIVFGNIDDEACKEGIRDIIRNKQEFLKDYDRIFLNQYFANSETYFLKFSDFIIRKEKVIELINLLSSVDGNVDFRISITIPKIILCRRYKKRIFKKTEYNTKIKKYLRDIDDRKTRKANNIVALPKEYQ